MIPYVVQAIEDVDEGDVEGRARTLETNGSTMCMIKHKSPVLGGLFCLSCFVLSSHPRDADMGAEAVLLQKGLKIGMGEFVSFVEYVLYEGG